VYHAFTYGHLLGEVMRRVTGQMPGDFIAANLTGPLGMDFHIGLAADQDHRVAELVPGPGLIGGPVVPSPFPQAASNPTLSPLDPNRREFRAAQLLAGNGQGTARALALMCAELMSPTPQVIAPDTSALARAARFRGPDCVTGETITWAAGYRLEDPASYGPRAGMRTFGHGGWGGALCFGDPDHRLAVAYVPNLLCAYPDGQDPRRNRIITAVYDAL
jgi:CubicO group peptidase (beta-lactamase class C family)